MFSVNVCSSFSVISSAGHYLKNFSREEALPILRESNEFMAAMRDAHKDKILAFATAIAR